MQTESKPTFQGRQPLAALLACVIVAGCAGAERRERTVAIGEVTRHPRSWVGKDVKVEGEVRDAYSLVFVKYFTLADGSGEIPVITSKPLPRPGEKLAVNGRVQEAFSLGTQSKTVIREQD